MIRVDGELNVLVNVYAPTSRPDREALFRNLAELPIPVDCLIGWAETSTALADLECRTALSTNEGSDISASVESLSYIDVSKIAGSTAVERQTIFRIKQAWIALWSTDHEYSACVAADCSVARPTSVTHLFWGCAQPQWAWRTVLQPWCQATGQDFRSLKSVIFAFESPTLSSAAVAALFPYTMQSTHRYAQLDMLSHVVKRLWCMVTSAVIHGLWWWKVKLLYGEQTT